MAHRFTTFPYNVAADVPARTDGFMQEVEDALDPLEEGTPFNTFDETAGRRLDIWDPINGREQLVYGDTGLRDISASLADIFNDAGVGKKAYLRRVGALVELTIDGMQATGDGGLTASGALPIGFRPATPFAYGSAARVFDTQLEGIYVASSGTVGLDGASAGSSCRATLTWTTSNAWPTTLPGLAVGTIPYQ